MCVVVKCGCVWDVFLSALHRTCPRVSAERTPLVARRHISGRESGKVAPSKAAKPATNVSFLGVLGAEPLIVLSSISFDKEIARSAASFAAQNCGELGSAEITAVRSNKGQRRNAIRKVCRASDTKTTPSQRYALRHPSEGGELPAVG